MRLGELEGIVGEEDGYTAESDAAILLQGLDIPDECCARRRTMGKSRGGQKVRVLLAQALFGHPQALLLDEPTNHLDLDSIHWLREFLVRYEGTLIVISHDRHFLNAVCTHIADIDYQTIITYTGGYDDMVMARARSRPDRTRERAARERSPSCRTSSHASPRARTRAARSPSRKKVERLEATELKSNIERPFIHVPVKRPSGKQTLTVSRRHQGSAKALAGRHPHLQRLHVAHHEGVRRSPSWALNGRGQRRRCEGAGGRAPAAALPWISKTERFALGPRGVDRVFRAGSPGVDSQRAPPSTSGCTRSIPTRPCRTSAACSARCCSRAKRG